MRRAPFVFILVWALGFAGRALAAEPVAVETKVVDVVASGDSPTVGGVEVVVRELVARLPVALQWSQASVIDPSQVLAERALDARIVARAWMDLSDPKRARIYVANAQSRRFLVRVVPLRDGYDEVAREVLGHIIESAVDAFLAGREVGVSREIAEREVTGESSEPPPPVPFALELGERRLLAPPVRRAGFAELHRIGVTLAYQVTDVAGAKAMMHGPAIGMALASPAGASVRFSSSATAHYRFPLHWDSPSVGARFDGGTLRLGAGAETDVARRVVLRGQLGVGVDIVHVAPYVETGSTAKAEAPLWVVSPVANAMVIVEAPLSTTIGWLAGMGCDIDLSGSSYFVANGVNANTVLSPWRAHPTALLGLVVRVGDEIDFAR